LNKKKCLERWRGDYIADVPGFCTKIPAFMLPFKRPSKILNQIVSFHQFIAKNALALRKDNVHFQFVNFSSVSIHNGKSLEGGKHLSKCKNFYIWSN
jgi:hypothetical protein